MIYISAWGFGVARFDRQGNAKASEREASDSAGLHVFFMPEKWICKTLVISSPISNNGRLGLAMVVEWN